MRQRGDEVAALLDLGAALRDAQARLATGDLRRLSQQGQQVVSALGREARQLAADAGQRVGDAAVREVEDTLHAALADPAASDAVRAGRLTSALSYAGFGSLEVSGVAPSRVDAGAPSRAGAALPERAQPVDAAAKQRAAQEAARQARADLEEARQDAGDRQRRLEEARQEQAGLDRQVEVASAELEQLRGQARGAATAARRRGTCPPRRRAPAGSGAGDGRRRAPGPLARRCGRARLTRPDDRSGLRRLGRPFGLRAAGRCNSQNVTAVRGHAGTA